MAYISGENRYQITYMIRSLDEQIDDGCEVRVIDAYVEAIDITELGFKVYDDNNKGQKPYNTKDLLKIYLYGYMNGIRSSRKLEKECRRNIEMMWLINSLKPDHSTIAAFLKNNAKAVKELFKQFVLFLKRIIIVAGELIAIDGTKIRANNAKKKHLNTSKIKLKIEYYECKIAEYIENITEENEVEIKIKDYQSRIEEVKKIQEEMKKEGISQICQTDKDSKSMKNNNGYEPCYNMQSVVDEKNKIIVAVDVVSEVNDQSQLYNMLSQAKENIKIEQTVVVADTGYFNQVEIKKVADENDTLYLKKQKQKQSNKGDSSKGYVKDDFTYKEEEDVYICPEGKNLEFECYSTDKGLRYRRYKCRKCDRCNKNNKCTKSKTGRTISRWEHEEIIEKVSKTTNENIETYRKRQCLVEHPFGTIKRSLGYTYFLRRGLGQVQAEASLICFAYNLKRAINILGVAGLIQQI